MSSNLYLVGVHHLDIYGDKRMHSFLEKISPKIIAIEWDSIRDSSVSIPNLPSLEEMIEKGRCECEESEKLFEENKDEFEKYAKECRSLGLDLNAKQLSFNIVLSKLIGSIPYYLVDTPRKYVQSHKNSELQFIDLPRENLSEIIESRDSTMSNGITMMYETDPVFKKYLLDFFSVGFDNWLESHKITLVEQYDKERMCAVFEESRPDTNNDSLYVNSTFDPERERYMGDKIRYLYLRDKGDILAFVGLGHLNRLENEVKDLNPTTLTLAECDSFDKK